MPCDRVDKRPRPPKRRVDRDLVRLVHFDKTCDIDVSEITFEMDYAGWRGRPVKHAGCSVSRLGRKIDSDRDPARQLRNPDPCFGANSAHDLSRKRRNIGEKLVGFPTNVQRHDNDLLTAMSHAMQYANIWYASGWRMTESSIALYFASNTARAVPVPSSYTASASMLLSV